MSKDVRRLFGQFQPEHYDLHVIPDAKNMVFNGTVTVRGQKTGRPSQRLTFHQKNLKIESAKVTKHDKNGDQTITVNRINPHKTYDEVRLHTNQMIYPGNYTIELKFSGQITRPMNGLYPCFFKEGDKEKILLATQFESHHAREVFPCIDEPEAKATFNLKLTTPSGQTVLSNTPVAKQTKDGNKVITQFETTPKMSTYLLAFVVGDIDYLEAKTRDGVVIRAYATPENVAFNKFALEVAVKCLEFYNDYFDIPYPLKKCDLIALPDFAAGAMENWGCITFREQCMFVDPKNTSIATKQYVAMVVAHELAHQWFGNLVTMRWWTDLWLNEGFASWIEYLAVDSIFPEWDMWTQFITDEQQGALRLDGLENTHAIEVPVHHPDEIRSIFDTISYGKGSSVIHMLHDYLGPQAFRDGLRHYLKTHAYGNTDTFDLWEALGKISQQPVADFMKAWTSQPGFPVVSVTAHKNHLSLEQSRYYANPKQERDQQVTWPIPTKLGLEPALYEGKKLTYDLPASQKLLKLNRGQSGFYRVAYQPEYLDQLAHTFASNGQEALSPLDRLGILTDAVETAKAGYSKTLGALKLLKYYKNEDNNAVWDVMSGLLNSLRGVMNDNELRETMKPFVRTLIKPQLARLGWEKLPDESHFDSLLRHTVIGSAAISDEPDVIRECLDRFEKMKQPEDLPPDLRGIIYNTAARHGDAKTFKKLLTLHNETTLSEERTTLAAAITGFEDPKLIQQALDLIDSDNVRLQDVAYWIAYSFMNRHAKQLTWEWFKKHWSWLQKNLESDLSFYRFPIYVARAFSDEAFLKEYSAFFEPILTPALERAYKQGFETIQWHAAWKERDLTDIKKFFTDQLAN